MIINTFILWFELHHLTMSLTLTGVEPTWNIKRELFLPGFSEFNQTRFSKPVILFVISISQTLAEM